MRDTYLRGLHFSSLLYGTVLSTVLPAILQLLLLFFSNFIDMHTEVNKGEIFCQKLLTQEMGGKDGGRELGEEMKQRPSRELVLGHWQFQVTARPSSSHHCLLGWCKCQAHRPRSTEPPLVQLLDLLILVGAGKVRITVLTLLKILCFVQITNRAAGTKHTAQPHTHRDSEQQQDIQDEQWFIL